MCARRSRSGSEIDYSTLIVHERDETVDLRSQREKDSIIIVPGKYFNRIRNYFFPEQAKKNEPKCMALVPYYNKAPSEINNVAEVESKAAVNNCKSKMLIESMSKLEIESVYTFYTVNQNDDMISKVRKCVSKSMAAPKRPEPIQEENVSILKSAFWNRPWVCSIASWAQGILGNELLMYYKVFSTLFGFMFALVLMLLLKFLIYDLNGLPKLLGRKENPEWVIKSFVKNIFDTIGSFFFTTNYSAFDFFNPLR